MERVDALLDNWEDGAGGEWYYGSVPPLESDDESVSEDEKIPVLPRQMTMTAIENGARSGEEPTAGVPALIPPEDGDSGACAEEDEPDEANRTGEGLLGLVPPVMDLGRPVQGSDKMRHRIENKRKRQQKQTAQQPASYWSEHKGLFTAPTPKQVPRPYK